MKNVAALVGGAGAGKTTFACMCDDEEKGIIAEGLTDYFADVKWRFKLGELPERTDPPVWDFVTIKQETLFRKWKISCVDCAGEVQNEILKSLYDLSKEWKAGSKKKENPFSKIVDETLDGESDELKDYVRGNIKKPIPEWARRLQKKKGEDGYVYRLVDSNIPKILFSMTLKDADRFIFTVDGVYLEKYWTWLQKRKSLDDMDRRKIESDITEYLYNPLVYYGAILYLNRGVLKRAAKKVAIIITKSYKFGVRKGQMKYEKEVIEKFNKFLKNVPELKEELRWTQWKVKCVGVPGVEGMKRRHQGLDQIFGVEEVIDWLFPLI